MSFHEYLCIHDNIFDRIQSTYQDRNILWGFISNEPNLIVKQQIYTITIYKVRRGVIPNIQPSILFRERGKTNDYRNKTFDEFRLMILDPTPKMNSEESDIISICFGTSIENRSN